jgi:hypothetical protein
MSQSGYGHAATGVQDMHISVTNVDPALMRQRSFPSSLKSVNFVSISKVSGIGPVSELLSGQSSLQWHLNDVGEH